MFLEAATSGFFLAATYAIAAFGLVIVFGVLDILNFAHGALLVLSAYLASSLIIGGVPYWIALVGIVAVMALAGMGLERTIFRRVEGEVIAGLVVSIGIIAIVDTAILRFWGPEPRTLPRLVEGSVSVGSATLPVDRLLIIAGVAVVLVLAQVALTRSRWGKILRATAQQQDAASLQGIPVDRVKTVAFGIGTALAALAGVVIASTVTFDTHLGESLVIKSFIVIIIGGVGSTTGAMVGASILGFAEAFGSAYFGVAVAQLIPLIALAAVLLVRPHGIFGRRLERV